MAGSYVLAAKSLIGAAALLASRARQRFSGLVGSDVVSLESVFLLSTYESVSLFLAICVIYEIIFMIWSELWACIEFTWCCWCS